MCRYGQLLNFLYLHRKRLTSLWGRYDQKTEILPLNTFCFQQKFNDQKSIFAAQRTTH